MLNLVDYLTALESEGAQLATMARRSGPDAAVPTCPDWVIRDLVLHVGEVHRWSTSIVRHGVTNPAQMTDDFLGSLPGDSDLEEWFTIGLEALVSTLRDTDADVQCFTFLENAPPPLLFWARRQTLETAMHRVDAESALGCNSGFPTALAADGIDELLTGFVPRKRSPLRSASPQVLQISPIDDPAVWSVTICDQPAVTVRTASDADCSVSGLSSDLYQALWNRKGTENLSIDGAPAVLDAFRESVKIRWG